MEFRAEYASNIAAGAKADAAGVRSLRTELEAVNDALKSNERAKGPQANPAGKGSDPGKALFEQSEKIRLANEKRVADQSDKLREKREKDRFERQQRAQALARGAAGTVAGGAREALGGTLAAAGIGGAGALARLALGYRGMAQLQAITMRTELQARQLFSRVDSAPAIRAADRFLQSIFSPISVAGKALSGIFDRVGNGLFQGFERAQPYLTAFVKGGIVGALELEAAYYDLRLALLPVTEAIAGMVEPTDSMRIVAGAGAIAVGGLALAATGSAAPFILAAAAIGTFISEVERLGKLRAAAETAISAVTGGVGAAAFSPQAESGRAIGYQNADDQKAAVARREQWMREQGLTAPKAAGAGQASGAAYAQGVAQGAAGGAGAAGAAGGMLADAVDKGFRDKAQIKSPSRVAKQTAGYWPEGAAQGIEDGAPRVQAASDRMVPTLGAPQTGASTGGPVSISLSVAVQVQGGAAAADEGAMRTVARRVFGEEARAFFMSLGLSPNLAAGGATT